MTVIFKEEVNHSRSSGSCRIVSEKNILQLALDLHQYCTGSCDNLCGSRRVQEPSDIGTGVITTWKPEHLMVYHDLKAVDKYWKKGSDRHKQFDTAVREVVRAALKEYKEQYLTGPFYADRMKEMLDTLGDHRGILARCTQGRIGLILNVSEKKGKTEYRGRILEYDDMDCEYRITQVRNARLTKKRWSSVDPNPIGFLPKEEVDALIAGKSVSRGCN